MPLGKRIFSSFPGRARNRATKPFLKTLFLDFLAAKKLKLDVLRKSSHQTFSQDALFGLFGRQRAQIGRLEGKKPQARFPAGLDSVGLIETLYDSFHLSEESRSLGSFPCFLIERMGLQVFSSSFKLKTIKLDVLRKNPQARFPAGLGSACLREKYFSNPPGNSHSKMGSTCSQFIVI